MSEPRTSSTDWWLGFNLPDGEQVVSVTTWDSETAVVVGSYSIWLATRLHGGHPLVKAVWRHGQW